MSYQVIEKGTKRVKAQTADQDVTFVLEFDDVAIDSMVRSAARLRNGIFTDGPLRVRILKRESVAE